MWGYLSLRECERVCGDVCHCVRVYMCVDVCHCVSVRGCVGMCVIV